MLSRNRVDGLGWKRIPMERSNGKIEAGNFKDCMGYLAFGSNTVDFYSNKLQGTMKICFRSSNSLEPDQNYKE